MCNHKFANFINQQNWVSEGSCTHILRYSTFVAKDGVL